MSLSTQSTEIVNGYSPILKLYREIEKAQDCGALLAALTMVFVGIDTMAWLSLPQGATSVQRSDFCLWVDTYLKTDISQPYHYVGIDVYAARCSLLHNFGSISDLHNTQKPPKTFGYLDNGPHRADDSSLVLISIGVLIRDFGGALCVFLETALHAPELKARINSRIEGLFGADIEITR